MLFRSHPGRPAEREDPDGRTLSGTLIKVIEKRDPDTNFVNWDLQTDEALPIASGMYLIHIEIPGVGEKVLKFGVIKKRIQLDLL